MARNNGVNSRTTSAPMPQQNLYSQGYQQRPSSSTQPVQPQSYGLTKNPVIMRDLDKPSGIGTQVKITKSVRSFKKCLWKLILILVLFFFKNTPSGNSLLHRPISATELRTNTRPLFGRKQFNNQGNVTANGAAKNLFGNYSQAHSTITSSGLNAIRKWW